MSQSPLRSCVLVAFGHACVMLCLRGIFGVGVAFELYFWRCMGVLLLVGVLVVVVVMAWHVVSSHNMGRYLTCVLQLPAKPRYTLTHNIRQSCTLATNDISSSSPVLTGEAYLRKRRLALRVEKSTSANLFQKIVPAKVSFFLRVLHLTEWLKVFCKFFCSL